MKLLNAGAILKCLRSYSGLSRGRYATWGSTEKKFQGCTLGCLYKCSGESVHVIKAGSGLQSKDARKKFAAYNIPSRMYLQITRANDGFRGSNSQRLKFMCLWFKELAREIRTSNQRGSGHHYLSNTDIQNRAMFAYRKQQSTKGASS